NVRGVPGVPRGVALCLDALDGPAESDLVIDLRSFDLPGVAERKPIFRVLLLPPVLDRLAEQAVIVADPVAIGGDRQGCHAFHEAGGHPTKPALADRGVRPSRPRS